MKRLLLAFALAIAAKPAIAETGLDLFTLSAVHHSRAMEVAVMFPPDGGTDMGSVRTRVPWRHPAAERGAQVGPFPVILVSHGWGGNLARLGWLSAGLAEKGAIVISVNHPNSTTGDMSSTSALNHWTRAQDLSLALDHVLKDPQFAPHIDAARIYATGFSYGGWTALSLAGLRGRAEGYDLYCKAAGSGSTHCDDIKKLGIEISALDDVKWNASYRDRRIAAAAAIDPGLTWGLNAADVEGLDVPTLLIALGQGKDRLAATDTSSAGSGFETLFPAARVERIVPATHFTALGLCKPEGAAILEEENDDPVCTDPAGTDRKLATAKIIDLIADHFNLD